jgi:hypothetical protein
MKKRFVVCSIFLQTLDLQTLQTTLQTTKLVGNPAIIFKRQVLSIEFQQALFYRLPFFDVMSFSVVEIYFRNVPFNLEF